MVSCDTMRKGGLLIVFSIVLCCWMTGSCGMVASAEAASKKRFTREVVYFAIFCVVLKFSPSLRVISHLLDLSH